MKLTNWQKNRLKKTVADVYNAQKSLAGLRRTMKSETIPSEEINKICINMQNTLEKGMDNIYYYLNS